MKNNVYFWSDTSKLDQMARNQIEKYVNELDIRKANYIQKQQKEYKFSRLKKSLDILKRASYFQTIPSEIINEIELIFKLMPVHELYYIKINEQEFKDYIELLNRLYIRVLDDYESYTEIVSSKSWGNVVFVLYIVGFFHKSIEEWFGYYTIPIVLVCLLIYVFYQNRERFKESPFNF